DCRVAGFPLQAQDPGAPASRQLGCPGNGWLLRPRLPSRGRVYRLPASSRALRGTPLMVTHPDLLLLAGRRLPGGAQRVFCACGAVLPVTAARVRLSTLLEVRASWISRAATPGECLSWPSAAARERRHRSRAAERTSWLHSRSAEVLAPSATSQGPRS